MSILIDTFRDIVSKSKDPRLKSEAESDVAYSTGFLNFDFLNGTIVHVKSDTKDYKYYSIGIQDGSMVMIIGRSGCGKTTWAVQAAANIVRPYKSSCIFHDDIEGGITEIRKRILTKFTEEEMNDKYICRNTGVTAENFYRRIRTIFEIKNENRSDYEYDTGFDATNGTRIFKLEPTVYLLDSIALLMPEKYTEEEELSGQMSSTAAAKANTSIFKRIIPMLKSANIILMVINHITEDVSINPMMKKKAQVSYLKQGEALPGGRAIVYLSNLMLRFDDHSKLKEEEAFGINGTLVDIGLVKSRNNRAGAATTMVFDQDRGFDPELSLFLLLKDQKKLGGAGAFLRIGECEIKFSQKNLKDKLYSEPELRKVFTSEVLTILKEYLEAKYTEPEINNEHHCITDSIFSMINDGIAA